LVATWLSENGKTKYPLPHIHALHGMFSKIQVHFLGVTTGSPLHTDPLNIPCLPLAITRSLLPGQPRCTAGPEEANA